MHYHCEIIMPPTDDPQREVDLILTPYHEDNSDYPYSFWDWYEIGGRWSGDKINATLDSDKLEEFKDKLIAMKITTSAVIAGKPRLQPEIQQLTVDAMWRAHFPDCGIHQCPLFAHSGSSLPGDIALLKDTPHNLMAHRFMFAGPEPFRVFSMMTTEVWNGVQHEHTTFDGTFGEALRRHHDRLVNLTDEARAKYTPDDDWLVVTVDYHS